MRERDIFIEALQQDPAGRAAWLHATCGTDADLQHRIERLLAEHQREEGFFLDAPPPGMAAISDPALVEHPGTQIGPYTLLQQIGEGGMGTVFLAEQTRPVQRQVAIKVIKAGMDTHQIIARFEAERQTLAMMDHVNIARVLDVGTTEAGRPFFVMELVQGVPITKFCDDNHLTPRDRLELFVPVCHAIQHAHQKGIIHRDVKPSNVMITLYDGKPVPKVIDFGVAKATEQQLIHRTLFTQYGTMVGTPEYMSPEQAGMSGEGVDTRSDIYSLGVLLYELLTGSTPLSHKRLRDMAYGEVLRMIQEEEPPKPSSRLSDSGEALVSISAQRQMEPARLAKLVRGELDWIVMKTLEKDRNRRYESASGLARDVERYLADATVQACPPSAAYRFRKFARKNKATLTTAAVVAAALIVGTVVSTWQAIRATTAKGLARTSLAAEKNAHRKADAARQEAEAARNEAEAQQVLAEQNFQTARAAVDRYFTLVSESVLLEVPGLQPLRQELLEAALHFNQAFIRQHADRPELQADLAAAYLRVAQIHADLDDPDASRSAFEAGFTIVENLRRVKLPSRDVWQRFAGVYREGESQHRDSRPPPDPLRTQQTIERGIAIWEDLVQQEPVVPGFKSDLAVWYGELGELQAALAHRNAAVEALEKSRALWQNLVREHPSIPDYRARLASSCDRVGLLLTSIGKPEDAVAAYRQSLELARQLVNDFPDVPHYRRLLAQCQSSLGKMLGALDPLEAEQVMRQALDSFRLLGSEFPAVPAFREDAAICGFNLANLLRHVGRPEQAAATLQEAIVILQRVADDYPRQSDHCRRLATYLYRLGLILDEAGRVEDARDAYAKSVTIRNRLVSEFPQVARYLDELAWQLATCPDVESRDARRAVALALQAVELAPHNGTCWRTLGVAQYRVGDYDAALQSLQTSMSLPSSNRSSLWFLAMTYWRQGKHDEAREYLSQAGTWMENNRPDDVDHRRYRSEAEALLGVKGDSP